MLTGGGSVLLAGAALRWSTRTANTLISSAHAQFTSSGTSSSTGAIAGFARDSHGNNHLRDRNQADHELPLPLSVRLAALGAACHTATLAVRHTLSCRMTHLLMSYLLYLANRPTYTPTIVSHRIKC